MTMGKIEYYKELIKAAFQDAATMPFRFSNATYQFRKAAADPESIARQKEVSARNALLIGLLAPAALVGTIHGLPAAMIVAPLVPYVASLAVAGMGTENDDKNKLLKQLFWPKMTAVRENQAAGNTPAPPKHPA